MPHLQAIAFFTIILFASSSTLQSDCVGKSTKTSEVKQPIFLRNDTNNNIQFILPINGTFKFKDKETFVLLCHDARNYLINSNANMSIGTCSNGKIKVANSLYNFEEIQCNKLIRGDTKATNTSCGNNEGFLSNIGYYIGRQKEFLSLIEICYNGDKGSTLYAKHMIYGEAINNASRSSFRPSFSTQGTGTRIAAAVVYKRVYQKSTFARLLGSSALAERYITKKSYISRGHLAPDADFILAPWQYTTYYYINACPQWQQINGGNWQKLESMLRKHAGTLKEDLLIVTGTYGVLKLPHANGTMQEMYLQSDKKLPIPEYTWKIVLSERRQAGIVLIILNNPFVETTVNGDYFCKSVCSGNGWNHNNWGKTDKGLVHCCEYKEFARVVHSAPKLHVRNILKGPYRD